MRTTSTMLAYDISDRMRANSAGRGMTVDAADSDGDGDIYDLVYVADNNKYPIATGASANQTTDCDTYDCIPAVLAAYDLAKWRNAVEILPGGASDITVTVNAAGIATHTITVYWDENPHTNVYRNHATAAAASA
jgi:hypothetical protein